MTSRRFTVRRRVRLGDTRIDGSLRWDALARYLQDLATDDADDSGLTEATGVWVVRRVVVEPDGRLPRLGEWVELTTFCGGSGPRWAERRTLVAGAAGTAIEARALWAHTDRVTGAPTPIPDAFFAVYGESAQRPVRARLEHPAPGERAWSRPWPLRVTDFDVLGHANNAVYWAVVEDELAARPGGVVTRAELEYRGGLEPEEPVLLRVDEDGPLRIWFTVDSEVRASASVWRT